MSGNLLSDRDFSRVSRVVRKVEGEMSPGRPLDDSPRLLIPQPVSITVFNDSYETIPARGVARIKSAALTANKQPYVVVDKPSTTFARDYVVNDALQIESKKWGQAFISGWVQFAYDTGTPAVGESFGAKPSYWTASKNYPAILDCYGVTDATNKIALGYLHNILVLPPVQLQLNGIRQSGGSATQISESNQVSESAVVLEGSAGQSALTLLTATSYEDPCLRLDLPGLWRFHLDLSAAEYTITSPVWPNVFYPAAPASPLVQSNWGTLMLTPKIWYRDTGAGAWVEAATFTTAVSWSDFCISASFDWIEECEGNDDGQTDVMVEIQCTACGNAVNTDTASIAQFFMGVQWVGALPP